MILNELFENRMVRVGEFTFDEPKNRNKEYNNYYE